MFDSDLARIYEVDTKSLKRAVKRNIKRFPPDFMFQLSREEFLRCQNYSSSWGGALYLPMVFTEHGAVMPASVLNSSSAIEASIFVVRAFIRLREIISLKQELSEKIKELELKTFECLEDHGEKLQLLFDAIDQLVIQKSEPREPIGYKITSHKT
jgi:hypothetical protein